MPSKACFGVSDCTFVSVKQLSEYLKRHGKHVLVSHFRLLHHALVPAPNIGIYRCISVHIGIIQRGESSPAPSPCSGACPKYEYISVYKGIYRYKYREVSNLQLLTVLSLLHEISVCITISVYFGIYRDISWYVSVYIDIYRCISDRLWRTGPQVKTIASTIACERIY